MGGSLNFNSALTKILVVEDDHPLREALAQMLALQGFDVVTTDSTELACEILDDEKFDLVLSDINMPGVSGLGLASILREAKTPVVAVAMTGGFTTVEEATKAGFSAFLPKPFGRERLMATLERALSAN